MSVRILTGDALAVLRTLPSGAADCCVTSPPYYGLRDYGHAGQIGLEPTPDAYVARMVEAFREVRRVLKDDGTLWLNLGDSYAGSGRGGQGNEGVRSGRAAASAREAARHCMPRIARGLGDKQLLGIPWRVAFALQADGWILRQEIIWEKPNPMPESVRDRTTKAHETVFLLAKSRRYYYDAAAIAEPVAPATVARLGQDVEGQARSARVPGKTNGPTKAKPPRFGGDKYGDDDRPEARTKSGEVYKGGEKRSARSVWTIGSTPFSGAHFAVMPGELARRCILAGSPQGGTVLDPFGGAGTTGLVADGHGRDAILIEINPANVALAAERIGLGARVEGAAA